MHSLQENYLGDEGERKNDVITTIRGLVESDYDRNVLRAEDPTNTKTDLCQIRRRDIYLRIIFGIDEVTFSLLFTRTILLILRLFSSYTVMTGYNYTNGYSLLSYLEYPIILVQEYILIFLVLKYLSRLNARSLLCAIIYLVLSGCLLLEIVPKIILTFLAVSTTRRPFRTDIFRGTYTT